MPHAEHKVSAALFKFCAAHSYAVCASQNRERSLSDQSVRSRKSSLPAVSQRNAAPSSATETNVASFSGAICRIALVCPCQFLTGFPDNGFQTRRTPSSDPVTTDFPLVVNTTH